MTTNNRRRLALVAFATVLMAGPAGAIDWSDGDYGPVVSTHMDAGGRDFGGKKVLANEDLANYVFRARLISLNAEKTINVCYDTEHMRLAAAWTGGYVNWKGAFKNQGPAISGDVLFGTKPGPGWSRDGEWADPRDPKEGPLPKDWAHYKGMYLHGDKVVLSYTVGGVAVLEMPSMRVFEGMQVFERHFTLGPSKQPMEVLAVELPGNTAIAAGAIGGYDIGEQFLTVLFASAPDGTEWKLDEGRMILRIPAVAKQTNFSILYVATPKDRGGDTVALKEATSPDLTEFTKGGPLRWDEPVETKGTLGEGDGAYVVDDIGLPDDNPWKSWIRFGAMDFFDDGRAALSTWDGDVWIASDIDDDLESIEWKRFATGLHQPLGLKIIDGVIHTAGRDQITRLHDLNGDGEADFYENFNNDAGLTPQRHEYVMDLETDADGNLYYCRSGHYVPSQRGENCCVMKLPPDGSKLEVFARGLREPNGMSIGPDGLMTVGDNEGDGIPATPIYALEKGRFFGFTKALRKGERETLGEWSKPIVWLPKSVDQSAGEQIWVNSDRWGPLDGHLLHTSYGNCKLMHVLIDRENDVPQGAVWEFPLRFTSGIMRGTFRKQDGQLYLCGLRGWGTSAAKEAQFCRVRYTGGDPRIPVAFTATSEGVAITFSSKLDPKAAVDFQNWAVETSEAKAKPTKPVELFVDEVIVSKDGRTVELLLEEAEPTEMMTIEYRLRDAGGKPIEGKLHATINVVPE